MSNIPIPGMRDFFGKKLGKWVYSQAAHLAPITLTKGHAQKAIQGAYKSEGLLGGGVAAFGQIREGIQRRGSYSFGDWFTGLNIGEDAQTLSNSLRNSRMAMRIGLPALAGVSAASSIIAPGNPLDTVARTGLQVGAHTIAAATLGQVHPWAGAAYAGYAGFNLLRRGNNIGPF